MKHPGIVTYGAFGRQASAWVDFNTELPLRQIGIDPFPSISLGLPPIGGLAAASHDFSANPSLPSTSIGGTTYCYFFPGRTRIEAARNFASAVNAELNRFGLDHTQDDPLLPVFAMQYGNRVRLVVTEPGVAGNAFTIDATAGYFTVSGATFTGGTASAITLGGGSPMVFGSTSEPSTDPGVSAAIHYRHDGAGTLLGQWWWDDSATSWRLFMGAGTATIAV